MFQKPPSFILLISFASAVTLSVITLGITGALCSSSGWNYCAVTGTIAAGPAIGVLAAIFGALFSGLGITWLIFIHLWQTRVVLYVIVGGLSGVATFAFVSGVILAWTANNVVVGASYHTAGAGSAFEFILMLSCVFLNVLMYLTVKHQNESNGRPEGSASTPPDGSSVSEANKTSPVAGTDSSRPENVVISL